VLGHLGVNVTDLALASSYYGELMPLLRYETFFVSDDTLAFRPAEGRRGAYLFLYPATEQVGPPYARDRPGLQHLAFTVPTRSAVREVHAHIVRAGGAVLHPPREWPEYPPPYFATFWLDPFGIMLEAVCHHDREQ
jgi:catechol 2,3-dioxygenase-like lactoylglutathione lyase family enzyme